VTEASVRRGEPTVAATILDDGRRDESCSDRVLARRSG
jgi:hypothetical protein